MSLHQAAIWATGVAAALLFAGMAVFLRELDPGIVHAQLTFSREAFDAVLGRWSPEGRARFAAHFVADGAFIACYSVFGWLLGRMRSTSGRPGSLAARSLRWLLPLAGVCDGIENLLHLHALATPAAQAGSIAPFVAGIAASAKYLCFAAFGLALAPWWRERSAGGR